MRLHRFSNYVDCYFEILAYRVGAHSLFVGIARGAVKLSVSLYDCTSGAIGSLGTELDFYPSCFDGANESRESVKRTAPYKEGD